MNHCAPDGRGVELGLQPFRQPRSFPARCLRVGLSLLTLRPRRHVRFADRVQLGAQVRQRLTTNSSIVMRFDSGRRSDLSSDSAQVPVPSLQRPQGHPASLQPDCVVSAAILSIPHAG